MAKTVAELAADPGSRASADGFRAGSVYPGQRLRSGSGAAPRAASMTGEVSIRHCKAWSVTRRARRRSAGGTPLRRIGHGRYVLAEPAPGPANPGASILARQPGHGHPASGPAATTMTAAADWTRLPLR